MSVGAVLAGMAVGIVLCFLIFSELDDDDDDFMYP